MKYLLLAILLVECSQVEPIGNAISENSDNIKKAAIDISDSTIKVVKPAAKYVLKKTSEGIDYLKNNVNDAEVDNCGNAE